MRGDGEDNIMFLIILTALGLAIWAAADPGEPIHFRIPIPEQIIYIDDDCHLSPERCPRLPAPTTTEHQSTSTISPLPFGS